MAKIRGFFIIAVVLGILAGNLILGATMYVYFFGDYIAPVTLIQHSSPLICAENICKPNFPCRLDCLPPTKRKFKL